VPELEKELDFATLAIAHRILTREQVEAAQRAVVNEARKSGQHRPLEDYFLETGILRAEEVWAVRKARERLLKDARARGQRIGGYEILGKVGEGGLGVVYRARQISMGRIVALKLLHEKWVGDDEFRKRFLMEARLVGRLSHPNLIQVFDVGRHQNSFYYSMEFVDGEPLDKRLDREGTLSAAAGADVALQVARALGYLQARKIVHRDVKPGNIMITKDGQAKLGDFGFVRTSLESVLSTEGEVLGTPDYISPEAARGERNLDFRSDLYSLGATLYHAWSGHPPFTGDATEVMEAHLKATPRPLAELRPDLPTAARRIVERLLRKNPAERPESFDEVVALLERLRAESTGVPAGAAEEAGALARMAEDDLRREAEALRKSARKWRWIAAAAFAFAGVMAMLLVWLLMRATER